MNPLEGFGPPDALGLHSKALQPQGSRARKQQRLRRTAACDVAALARWPADWHPLLRNWLSAGSAQSRWVTLTAKAGPARLDVAQALIAALLRAGWIEVQERHDVRLDPPWAIEHLRWLHAADLRRALGLPDADALQAAADLALHNPPDAPLLAAAWAALAAQPAARIPERAALLRALAQWQTEGRSGARADFAYFARGDTKAIRSSEWDWLEAALPLGALGVSRHAAVLWLKAPLALHSTQGVFDLGALGSFMALPVEQLAGFTHARAALRHWTLIENRTSFERHARQSAGDEAVLWLPGQPPSAWRVGFARLLQLAPAPVRIACDPDPAGIDIALAAGAVADAAGVHWQAWKMDVDHLNQLSASKALNADDVQRLARLLQQALPPVLRELALHMQAMGRKGEQEGYL